MDVSSEKHRHKIITIGAVLWAVALVFLVFWVIFGETWRTKGTTSAEAMFWAFIVLGFIIFGVGMVMFCRGLYKYPHRDIFGLGIALVGVGLLIIIFTVTEWKDWLNSNKSLYYGVLGLGIGILILGVIFVVIALVGLSKRNKKY